MRSRMTIIPKLFSHWWEALDHPHRLIDQHFARSLRPDQFFSSVFDRPPFRGSPYNYYQPWIDWMKDEDEERGSSIVKSDKDKFRVALDVQQFKPEEVNVKVVDNYIVVEGKHEDKVDDHGIISRHFVRKYLIPDQCDPERATSTLSPEGILTVTAPRKPEAIENKREKVLKIERVEKKPVEENREEPEKLRASQSN
ncbi:protein lethal(2)essential for life-like [Hylaeus volcanicus]|uniref:protein lethal(2)essential for life-like n=1 Tax=Hylaeus volcanicus TaxID=313075 RepID=UPI0023B7F82B|nr:protein lethal(2)essential for life-like [Hylaeus volcanicus]